MFVIVVYKIAKFAVIQYKNAKNGFNYYINVHLIKYNCRVKYLRLTSTLLFGAIVIIFVAAPVKYMQSFVDGVTVWAFNVLPAIFPFMVLTTLTLKLQGKRKRSLTKLSFGIDCDNVFFSSILCGYPIVAKAIADSNADTATATAMCGFCSTAGPIFMIATVGGKLLQNTAATIILLSVHIVSAVLNGVIYRKKREVCRVEYSAEFSARDIGDTVTSSALSVISVGGLIALFYMLTDMVKSFLPANAANSLVTAFIIGLFEMTNGVFSVCSLTDVATATVLCSALLSFGGLCVFAQCYAFLGNKQVKPLQLLKMKITRSAIATILSFVITKIFM